MEHKPPPQPPEVNPYASPSVARPKEPAWKVAGIGVFRYGPLLIVHEQAELPKDVCIMSGEPATHVREVQVRLSHWARWPREYLHLEVGVNRSWNFWLGRGRTYLFIGMLVLLALWMIGVMALPGWRGEAAGFAAFCLSLPLTCLIYWLALGHPLIGRRSRYYWLAGAHRDYLAKLPEWPYGT